jgi:16S rRNA (guanine966-N2)-methyltransferase
VREATFNALGSLGALDGAAVLDLFAGSGARAIEALSRGAVRATLVERDGDALAAIRTNLERTGMASSATVVNADATTWEPSGQPFDLVVCDPPYAFDGWAELLARLPAPLAVLESDRDIEPGPGWLVVRARRYGTTVVTIVRRDTPPTHDVTEAHDVTETTT